jgi:geranylgeranyl diphosphate synthase type I
MDLSFFSLPFSMEFAVPESAQLAAPPLLDRLAPPEDRPRIDRELEAFLEIAGKRFACNPHLSPLFSKASAFVLEGGKRVRPRLGLASYRILRGVGDAPTPVPSPVVLTTACLELFHAFMLVHDDLIDGSTTRRDRPTLHEAIRLDSDDTSDAKTPADLGLLAGDLLFALGMRLVARSGLPDRTLGRVHRFLADMLFETGLGEALDVLYGAIPLGSLTEPQIIEAYLRKTARYTVSGPLVLGAILGGARGASCRSLARFGDLLGLGYQIRNDLDALDADPSQECSDLDTGKRTFILWTAHRRLNAAGRQALDEALGLPVGLERRRRLMGLIHASGAIDIALAKVEALRHEAASVLRSAPLSAEQRRGFAALTAWFGAAGIPIEVADPAVAAAVTHPSVSGALS